MKHAKGFAVQLFPTPSFLLVSLLVFGACRGAGQEAGEVLTQASQVLSLSAERAQQRISISVTGVVTAAEPDWRGRFFVQDASGGVFVDNISSRQPAPGDVVEVSGSSHPGAFAPIISYPHWKKIGSGPLPAAKIVPLEQLMGGIEDGQRVEISGLVRRRGLRNRDWRWTWSAEATACRSLPEYLQISILKL